jgi:hypothetical protein
VALKPDYLQMKPDYLPPDRNHRLETTLCANHSDGQTGFSHRIG